MRDRLATANDINHGRHEPRDDEQASHDQGRPSHHHQAGALHGRGAWAAMAPGEAASSGTARLSRPARTATSNPWNTTSAAKVVIDSHPGADQVEVGVVAAQRLKPRAGHD